MPLKHIKYSQCFINMTKKKLLTVLSDEGRERKAAEKFYVAQEQKQDDAEVSLRPAVNV